MAASSATPFINCLSNFSTVGMWNSQIREAVNQGHFQKALSLFRQMKHKGSEPNKLTFPFVAKACGKLSNPRYSQIIHTHVIKSAFWSDIFVQTSMVDMYIKCSLLEDAYNLFERMPERDLASWNSIILGSAQMGFVGRVFCLFHEMRLLGIRPDSVTVMGLTQGTLHMNNLQMMKAIHSLGIQIALNFYASVNNTWIAAYSKCGDFESAERVFCEIEFDVRTVVSWNSIIAGYAYHDKYLSSLQFYKWMLMAGFMPDTGTMVSLLSSCVKPQALNHGMLVHCHCIHLGYDSETSVINTLISMYCKCGDVDSARFLFHGMSGRTSVTWTAMIGGYAEKGNMDEAVSLFNLMEADGVKPDTVTLVSLISGCGLTGALDIGKWIDNYATHKDLKESVVICNALIDMYAKCGSMGDSWDLFLAMRQKNVVTWTTMIAGCALNGKFIEALDLFFQMVESGLKPNHITFLAVLQACTHGGLIEKGWECFNMMMTRYGINPGLDHYSCMADLLGRKGRIKEALKLIENMPFKPDAGIWGTLLNACKIYHNLEIGEYVTHCLLDLEPWEAVSYVEMANIYASLGQWDRVARVRSMMKSNKIKKTPGQSLIQVNGETHAFTVDERGHSEGEEIYNFLDGLMLQAKAYSFSVDLEDFSE